MTVHLIKLCVGCDSIEDLQEWQLGRLAEAKKRREEPVLQHWTRMMPKRRDEVLDGGSLYWVIKGKVSVRQRIVGLHSRVDEEGRGFCAIQFDPLLVATEPRPCRPFQGWRYLEPADVPLDLALGRPAAGLRETDPARFRRAEASEEPPAEMLAELRALGLI